MWKWLKGYWDAFGGIIMGILMAFLAKFQLYGIQVCYSVIILILVNIGTLRIVKQTVDKNKGKKRAHNVIDTMVDMQPSVKAINISQNPTKDGEMLGRLVIKLWEGLKVVMKKLKKLYDKFKGIVLAIALGVLTAIEYCGGYINNLLGAKLTFNGVEIIPIVTLGLAILVGILSNGWTKEQNEQIKALIKSTKSGKSSTNEIIKSEIKKNIKTDTAKLTEASKDLSKREVVLEGLEGEYESLCNTFKAKREMNGMTPRLATDEDVRSAEKAVLDCEEKIRNKKNEINVLKDRIKNLTETIDALKSQL